MSRRPARQGGGLASAVLGDIELLRPQRGRQRSERAGSPFRFSARARQLWRYALGSNAAVLKKISRGGTHSAKALRAQMDYLFSKSASIFGNAVVHDPNARGLAAGERQEIAETWADGWEGAPKNGHTTHLLLSFPSHVRPEQAKLIAEAWAFEMLQSGEHQDEEWAYVAALHTDRAHPHVHIVVNNRGLVNEEWFFMAREHHFNLAMMKGRMVEIAAEEGVLLDATSRAERGILTYGPSRSEIERAREQGRAPEQRPREGRALEDALATVSGSAEVLRGLAHAAALTGLKEVAARIGEAEVALGQGGVLNPFPADASQVSHSDLERHFGGWMTDAAEKIARQPVEERAALRQELYAHARGIARDLGDRRGAELMARPPQTRLYSMALVGSENDLIRREIMQVGAKIGLNPKHLEIRLATGAQNAFEERDWMRADLISLAGLHQLDLGQAQDGQRALELLDGLHAKALDLQDRARRHEAAVDAKHLVRTLKSMARVLPATGTVSFGNDDQAARFAADLRERYGDVIAGDLTAGRTEALRQDFPDEIERAAIAAAIVSAAKVHAGMGLTLREVDRAERGAMHAKQRPDRETG